MKSQEKENLEKILEEVKYDLKTATSIAIMNTVFLLLLSFLFFLYFIINGY